MAGILHIPHAGDVPEGTKIKVHGPCVVVPNPSGPVRFDEPPPIKGHFVRFKESPVDFSGVQCRPKPDGAPGEWEFLHDDGSWRETMPDWKD